MTCANNCRGVNPNSVIVGGTAVLAAASIGTQLFFGTRVYAGPSCMWGPDKVLTGV